MRIPQLLIAAVITSAPVYAQDTTPPAHIAFVEGSAIVYHAADRVTSDPRGAQQDSEPAVVNMPIVQGDRVQTSARSRVEVMFPDGGGIAIESDTDVEFVTATRVRVIAGAIEHLPAQPVDPRSPSTQNLPPDLQPYGPQFDQNGSWQYKPQYGNVWYPTAVSADWRPYYDGYWSSYPAYGWTWIGYERWAWPTHHYGRWGYAHSRWFWIPGHSYGSAWVSWGTAPGYVSWCPLGYDGRPVVGLSVGFHSSWNAWTVIPRDRFGARGYPARRYAVEPSRIAASEPFIEHRAPPARQPRGSFTVAGDSGARRPADGPSRAVGTAVPRGQSAADTRVPSTDFRRNADTVRSDQAGRTYDRRDVGRPTSGGRRIATEEPRPMRVSARRDSRRASKQPRRSPCVSAAVSAPL